MLESESQAHNTQFRWLFCCSFLCTEGIFIGARSEAQTHLDTTKYTLRVSY